MPKAPGCGRSLQHVCVEYPCQRREFFWLIFEPTLGSGCGNSQSLRNPPSPSCQGNMQPKPAVDGEMAAGSLMVKPAVFKFHSSISHAPGLFTKERDCAHWQHRDCPSESVCRSYELPEAAILVCATRSPADWGPGTVQLKLKRKSCTKRKPQVPRVRLVRSPRCACESSDWGFSDLHRWWV
jgi:hypothetical protein